MGKVTRYRSVLSYAKRCISEQQHQNCREFPYRILFRQLPAPTSSLPFGEWANDLVTELLHKSTLSALLPRSANHRDIVQIHLISIYLPEILSLMPFPLIVPTSVCTLMFADK